LRQAYQDCNLLAMPSSYGLRADGSAMGEGFGITYLEAAMAGRASLACIEGGQSDLIQAGKTGWLVQPNVDDLLINLQAILNNLGELARRGAAAKQYANLFFANSNFQNRLANAITED
jgi:phosphatidylinositol alpha-1,6-mannosyltransferase